MCFAHITNVDAESSAPLLFHLEEEDSDLVESTEFRPDFNSINYPFNSVFYNGLPDWFAVPTDHRSQLAYSLMPLCFVDRYLGESGPETYFEPWIFRERPPSFFTRIRRRLRRLLRVSCH